MKSRGKKKDSYPLRRSKAYERNLKNFKILVAYDPFQEEVTTLRKRLKIGLDGMCADNPKINWIEYAEEKDDEVLNSKSFLEQEGRIARQFSEGKITLRQRHRQMRLWYTKAPKLDLFASIDAIIEKFHLPLNYKQAIIAYVISGNIIRVPHKNWEPNTSPAWNDRDKARSLSITIFSQLTKDELNELNDYIDWVGKKTLPQYSDFENAELKVTLKEKRSEMYMDDKGKLKHPSHHDLADEYLKDRTKGTRVRGLIRDLEQQQKERFTKRAKK